jgi:acetyl esterase/lipase
MNSAAPSQLALAIAAPLPPARIAPNGVRVLNGVAYAALPGVRPLELDLYLPAEASIGAPVPVVAFLHGGGWRVGSRHSVGPAYTGRSPSPFERFAAEGIAVASIDYRLSGEARWPAQLHDAKSAVRWLRTRAGELDIDPDRIAAWGESSGGHLAALLGLTGAGDDDPELEGEVGVVGPSSAVAAVVAWYPPTDLAALPDDLGADSMDPDSREALLLGAPLATVPELVAQASPVRHVRPGAPPFLLLHGSNDGLIPHVQSVRLHDPLLAADDPVEFDTYDGADHMWRGAPEAADLALDRTVEFLRRQLTG